MQSDSQTAARDTAPTHVGTEDLAEGLMLLRASTLKMIRLQLAMERNDRRVALEAVDDLVALDRRLEDYLADVPASHEQLMFRGGLEDERAALNREKLTLAAEVIRREPPGPVEIEAPDPASWDGFEFDGESSGPKYRAIKWLALTLVILAAAAAAAYALVGPAAVAAILVELQGL